MTKDRFSAANPSEPPHRFDVVIAGAGMAGTTCALALHQAGLKVALVDPVAFEDQLAPTFDGRASAIAYACFRQWQALGVGDLLAPHAQRIDKILVTDGRFPGAATPAPLPFSLSFDASEIADRCDGEPLGYLVENRRMRQALTRTVKERGIEVFAPVKVVDVKLSAGPAEVILGDGRTLVADLVVGSEGRASVIRQKAGIGTIGWPYDQSGVVATVRLSKPHQGIAHEYFLPNGPFAILPLTDNRASLVWTERRDKAEALKACSDAAFMAHLYRRFGEFCGDLSIEGPRFVYPLSMILAERITGPRVALVGDSAHGMHPIAGQGLNLGLKDAAALAEVLYAAKRAGEDLGSEIVLERYAAWRRFDNVSLVLASDAFVRLFSTNNPLVRLARGIGMSLVDKIGPARRFFMEEAGGAVGDLPQLLRGIPL